MPAFRRPFPHNIFLFSSAWLRALFFLSPIAIAFAPIQTHAQTEGITVGQPKVYDNQSLTIMLEELNARLHQIQVIDQPSLMKALGLLQGSQQQDVSRSFDLSISLTPKAAAAGTAGSSTGNPDSGSTSSSSDSTAPTSSDSAGGSGSKSSKSGSDKSSPSFTGSALPDLIAAPTYKPEYGESSADLLSDQIDLTYQIFNLRMLLERSVTDRLRGGQPRRQAVLGFNVSLDPPSNATDAAAYVEITLSSAQGPIALVASMPQEKTYNASALSSSSTAFGGSAVAKIITIGYNQRKRSQTFFLYRDSDTLAIERPPVNDTVTFGWVFRPVLGKRSISSGMRQMFAVVALPETDLSTDTTALTVTASAKTYWLHYDKNTSTTVRHPGFWDWSSKRLPKETTTTLSNVAVFPTAPIETALHPAIRAVQLLHTTSGTTVLQIEGENFFTGTTVTIGDKTYRTPEDGLYLKSSQTMLVTANADVLSRSLNAVVNGRYGASVPLYNVSRAGMTILPKLMPKGLKFSELQLKIRSADPSASLTTNQISNVPKPLITLNGTTIPYPLALVDTSENVGALQRRYILATVTVPNSMLQARDNRVGIIFPLLGDAWYSEAVIYDDTGVQVLRMSSGKTTTLLISRPGIQFTGNWRLLLDKTYDLTDDQPVEVAKPKEPTPTSFTKLLQCRDETHNTAPGCYVVKVVADTKFLSDYKKLVLITDTGYVDTIDVPAATSPTDKPSAPPKITGVKPPTVGLNEVVTIAITGSGLDTIKQVSFEGKPLTFWAASEKDPQGAPPDASGSDETKGKGSELRVLLTRDVTGKEGHQELLLQVDTKTMVTTTITVSPAPTATKSDTAKEKKSP